MIYRYRIVPQEYTAKGIITAPLLSGIISPLDTEVQQFAAQMNKLAAEVGVPPITATGFSQDTSQTGAPSSGNAAAVSSPSISADGTFTAASPSNAFTQDVGQAESVFNTVSAEIPRFVNKYRNLNLLLIGFQMSSDLPLQIQGLKQSFQQLKSMKDLQSASFAMKDMQGKVTNLVQIVRTAFQKPATIGFQR